MASRWPQNSVKLRRISNIPGLNDQKHVTSVKTKFTKEPYRRDQHLSNAHPFESKVANSQICLRCGEEIADLSKVFVGKCCKNQSMCWKCYASTKSPYFPFFPFHCNCCGQTLFKDGFHLQNLSAVLMSSPPKCDSCELEKEPEYILPDDRRICSGCFDNQMFTRSTKSTDKQQVFIGYKTNDIITPMKLFPIQRVHRIAYGKWNNYQGLACSCCRERLQGNCYELECHHHVCFKCCDSNVFCTICREHSDRIDTVEFHGIQHPNLFNRKVTVKEECMETKQALYGNRCTVHQKVGIFITCDTCLCSDCFDEIADRKVSVIDERGATEEHCICRCIPVRGQHIISVASLIEAQSQIEYLENVRHGQCQKCFKSVQPLVKLRECGHELCFECVSKGQGSKHHQRRQHNKLNGKSQMLFGCVIYSCKSMVPIDQLKVLNSEPQSASIDLQASKRETVKSSAAAETRLETEKVNKVTAIIRCKGRCSVYCCTRKSFIKLQKCNHRICQCCLEIAVKDEKEGVLICGVDDCEKIFLQEDLDMCFLEEKRKAMPMTDLEMTKLLNKKLVANSPPSSTNTEKSIDTSESMEFADEACDSGTDDGTPMVIKQQSDKDHKRMTAGNSSNSSKAKQSEKHKHESGPSGPIEDKLSPPQSTDSDQEMTDNEAVGSLEMTDRENDNNCPSKKRLKTYFKEKPFTDTCSHNKNHQKAIIEFRECSHRYCEDCIEKKLSIKCETVFCGYRTGQRDVCATKVPLEYVVKFFKDREENNMDCEPTDHAVKRCDNPGCKAVQTSDVDIQMTFHCGHHLCVYCCHGQGENTAECKVPSCVKIKWPTRGACSVTFCGNRADAEFSTCGHMMCYFCLLNLFSYGIRRKTLFCGIRKWMYPCETVIPNALLTSYIRDIEHKPSMHLNERPYNRYCNQNSCLKKAVIEFRKCKHRFCEHCVLNKTSGRETVICYYGRTLPCETKVPTSVIKEYLHNEMNKTVCDNPGCKANSESNEKRDIRKRFSSCGHKLCVICVSEQQHSYEDEVVCMAPACNPRQTEAMDIAGIPNVGLTCYASCVLQVLGQTPKFTSMLREFSNGTSQHGVAEHLDELLKHVNKVGKSQNFYVNWVSMNNLMHAIFRLDQSFQRYQENDCHSFIMSLFNALAKTDEDRKEQKPKPIENSFLDGTGMDETSNSRAEDSSEGRRSTSRGDGSIARREDTCPTKLFESRIASQFIYSTCSHTENVADQLFYSLLLSATKDSSSIHYGLDLYFKSEDFTHNKVPCRECRKPDEHTTTSRTPLLSSAPQILMIQLARFSEISRHGAGYKELEKTYHSVEFERTLKIKSSYTTDKRELEYELYGVVLHRGNMHGGHYTSCVRNLKTKKWYYCSDSSVSETSEESIFQEWVIKHAYLLFYSRKA